MKDDIQCEEVFEVQVEMAPEPVLAEGVDLGRLYDRMRAPRDWNGKEWADAVYGPESVTQNYWCDQAWYCAKSLFIVFLFTIYLFTIYYFIVYNLTVPGLPGRR